MLRHDFQHRAPPTDNTGLEALAGVVHPLTAELMAFAAKGETKKVAKMDAAEIQAAFDAAEQRASPSKQARL